MQQYPKTILEFEKQFSSEAKCREYLCQIKWPNGFICPHCHGQEFWETKRGQFRCNQCDFQASVTAGTIFQDSKISLRIWFRAIWHIVSQKQGISAKGLQRVLGLTRYETAWILLHKLRKAMVRPGRDRLIGPVQVDETYIGGPRPGKRGRGAENKTLVFVAVEAKGKQPGRIRLHVIKDASGDSLIPSIKETIELGSEIHTDGWKGYDSISTSGFKHTIIRKTADVGKNLLPLANLAISLLKRWLQGTHQGGISTQHLNDYLDEFVFRFNRRTSGSRGLLFYRLIQQAVNIPHVKTKDIRQAKQKLL